MVNRSLQVTWAASEGAGVQTQTAKPALSRLEDSASPVCTLPSSLQAALSNSSRVKFLLVF